MQQKFILRYMYRSAGYLEGKGRYTVLDIMVGYPVWPYFRPFYSSFTECSWKIMSQHFTVLILHYKQLHTDIIFSSLRLKIPSCIIGRIFSGFEPKPIRPIFNKNNNFLANEKLCVCWTSEQLINNTLVSRTCSRMTVLVGFSDNIRIMSVLLPQINNRVFFFVYLNN